VNDHTTTGDGPRPTVGADGWFWASDAPTQGARIEMRRRDDGGMDVRTFADPGKVLSYTRAEWVAWLDGASHAEFDHLWADDPTTTAPEPADR
jgi:hypothetical protein